MQLQLSGIHCVMMSMVRCSGLLLGDKIPYWSCFKCHSNFVVSRLFQVVAMVFIGLVFCW